ncbi:MAG: GNAT family N-acetyltransferase [Candidatus Entotheonellia bacterium]
MAVATETAGEQLVGAALLSRDQEYGPVLDLLFIKSQRQRRGLATALVASAMNALHQAGDGTLTSCYQLANPASQAWHRACGFAERPDLRYAQAYYRRAQQELFRREKQGGLTAREYAALHADVQYWRDQIEALERLADEKGYAAVNPRRPHW